MNRLAKVVMGMVAMLGMVNMMMLTSVSAANGDCEPTFLGMRPWYYNLTEGSGDDCQIKQPEDGDAIPGFIFTIVMNVLYDLEMIAGLLATGFVIFGGYQIMMSSGDAGAMARGKKTVTRAVIGLAIAVMAQAITAFIADSFTF